MNIWCVAKRVYSPLLFFFGGTNSSSSLDDFENRRHLFGGGSRSGLPLGLSEPDPAASDNWTLSSTIDVRKNMFTNNIMRTLLTSGHHIMILVLVLFPFIQVLTRNWVACHWKIGEQPSIEVKNADIPMNTRLFGNPDIELPLI